MNPTIPEMNRTIGELDGWIFSRSGKTAKKGKNGPWRNTKDFRYHDSWKWLKPVIDEIFGYALVHPEKVKPIIEMRIVVNIKFAHERVFEFAKWFQTLNNEYKIHQ